jgi:hypothetical protein
MDYEKIITATVRKCHSQMIINSMTGSIFSEYFGFPLSITIPQVRHIQIHSTGPSVQHHLHNNSKAK